MPLRTETIDLAAERDDLQAEMADLAEEHATWEGKQEYANHLMQEGMDLERYINGVEWLQREHDCECITLQGLTAGDRNAASDATDGHAELQQSAHIAVGTREAPWLQHDPDAPGADLDGVKDTMRAVNDLPPGVVDWLDERIGDMTHLREETGNGYMELLAKKLDTSETPESANG